MPPRARPNLSRVESHKPDAPQLPTGTVTFLFTDIEGSTRLLHELGPGSVCGGSRGASSRPSRGVRRAGRRRGRHPGRRVLRRLPDCTGAVTAAIAGTTRSTAACRRPDGPPYRRADRDLRGIVGVDVHRGAHVAALAHGGQVVITEPPGVVERAARSTSGAHRLKDFEGPVHLPSSASRPLSATPHSRSGRPADSRHALPRPRARALRRGLCLATSTTLESSPSSGPAGRERRGSRSSSHACSRRRPTAAPCSSRWRRSGTRTPAARRSQSGSARRATTPAASRRHRRTPNPCRARQPRAAPPGRRRPLADLARSRSGPAARRHQSRTAEDRRRGQHDLPPMNEDEAVLALPRARHAVRPDIEDAPAVARARSPARPLAARARACRRADEAALPGQLLERLGQRLDLLKGGRDADERHATLRATIEWSHDLLDSASRSCSPASRSFAAAVRWRPRSRSATPSSIPSPPCSTRVSLRRRTGPVGSDTLLDARDDPGVRRRAAREAAGAMTGSPRVTQIEMLAVARSARPAASTGGRSESPVVARRARRISGALDWCGRPPWSGWSSRSPSMRPRSP